MGRLRLLACALRVRARMCVYVGCVDGVGDKATRRQGTRPQVSGLAWFALAWKNSGGGQGCLSIRACLLFYTQQRVPCWAGSLNLVSVIRACADQTLADPQFPFSISLYVHAGTYSSSPSRGISMSRFCFTQRIWGTVQETCLPSSRHGPHPQKPIHYPDSRHNN